MIRTAAALFACALALPLCAELTPQELRGRQIYRTGESPSGQAIAALVGTEDLELPATSLPCASCHGRDGRGNEEGGVRPSNIQWHALTKPYSVPNAAGRARPPYTPALLKRAITMGIDPAKQRLHVAMPRYRLSLRDADDLVAYLGRIGSDRDPGLTDERLALGLMLPSSPDGDAIRAALKAHFDAVNAGGGIFGRRIRLTEGEEPFAIVAAHVSGREREAGELVARQRIPTIAAFSTRGDDANRYLFHLLAGIEEQSLALIGNEKVRIIHNEATADIATRLRAHVAADSSTVLFLSDAEALAKLVASRTAKTILIPAPFMDSAALSAAAGTRVVVAMPTTRAARDTALAAAQLLTRALERAGRDVDRESLVEVLETFRRETTGLSPPVTWTPSRRVGTTECNVVAMR